MVNVPNCISRKPHRESPPPHLAAPSAISHNCGVAVQELIGFEAALGELGALYVAAQGFALLRPEAEAELLPRTEEIGARLRAHLRRSGLDPTTVDSAARDIAALRDRWQKKLADLRASATYQQALAAWKAGDPHKLVDLLPQVIADLAPVMAPPPLFFGVSAAPGRRRPGTSPFLTPAACAQKIAAYRDTGVTTDARGSDWWDTELSYLDLVDDPEALESPIALRFDAAQLGAPVFAAASDPGFRVYSPVLRAPFSVVLQEEADDEWWQAYDESFAEFREALATELRALGIRAEVVAYDHGARPT